VLMTKRLDWEGLVQEEQPPLENLQCVCDKYISQRLDDATSGQFGKHRARHMPQGDNAFVVRPRSSLGFAVLRIR
jgi:hypothetical protein